MPSQTDSWFDFNKDFFAPWLWALLSMFFEINKRYPVLRYRQIPFKMKAAAAKKKLVDNNKVIKPKNVIKYRF